MTEIKNCAKKMMHAADVLCNRANTLQFNPPVAYVYNPLHYARNAHFAYVQKFARMPKKVLFVGMNPGPWGMTQTGVPFGEISAVREWMGICCPVNRPEKEHAKRPVEGFECQRSEVSGRRLWGLFKDRFVSADTFFKEHFVANYCPLLFMEESGRNRTPDKLAKSETCALYDVCDKHLVSIVKALSPRWVIGIGGFAHKRIAAALEMFPNINNGVILHPSPASPAANKDWAGTATRQMEQLGVW